MSGSARAATVSSPSRAGGLRFLVGFSLGQLLWGRSATATAAASALVGAMQYGTGIFTAAMVGWFADGTPWTMGWIVALGGMGALAAAMLLVRPVRTARA